MSQTDTQTYDFTGASFREAGDKRADYERQCREAGVWAHRLATTTDRPQFEGRATVSTEYGFTDLDGVWTAEAEGEGILIYFCL